MTDVVDLDRPTEAMIRRAAADRIMHKIEELAADVLDLTDLWSRTRQADFNVVDLVRIAELLGCSLTELIGGTQ
ncbi:hypothetical protein [Mycolicibacterium sp. HS_4_1]